LEQRLARANIRGKPEVSEHNFTIAATCLSQQHVFWLEISVHNPMAMAGRNASGDWL